MHLLHFLFLYQEICIHQILFSFERDGSTEGANEYWSITVNLSGFGSDHAMEP
jgi:hypothetical protein